MKVAVIHDDFVQHGGAERLVLVLSEIWPEADYYTSLATKEWVAEFKGRGLRLTATWMQRLPFKKVLYRFYFFLYPLAFESLDLGGYDLVISSSARFAHAVITKPQTAHIAYINSPARMFWEANEYFYGWGKVKRLLLTPLLSYFRLFDYASARRPDYLIANSQSVAKRIRRYWGLTADAVIHPFVENSYLNRPLEDLVGDSYREVAQDYFIVISRLSRWKRVATAVTACNELSKSLIVVGTGPEVVRLRKLAGPTVKVLGYVSEKRKIGLLANSRALIQTQREDFGTTVLEALACGKPVIAFNEGGAGEMVLPNVNGLLFDEQSPEAVAKAILAFEAMTFSPVTCRQRASAFTKDRFISELRGFVNKVVPS